MWMHCAVHLFIYFGLSVLILAVEDTEGEVLCAHESEDVDIVWPNTPKDSSYNVASRAWYKDSNTVLALSPDVTEFIEGPDYKDRLMQIKDTGIKIKAVTKADSGSYVQHTRFKSDMNIYNASIYLLVTDAPASVCKPWISQDGLSVKAHLPSDYVCAALRLEWKYANKTVTTQSHSATLQLGTDSAEGEYRFCAVGAAAKCFEGNISEFCINYTTLQSGNPAYIAVPIVCVLVTVAICVIVFFILKRHKVNCKGSYGDGDKSNTREPLRTDGEGAELNGTDLVNSHGEGAELNGTNLVNSPGEISDQNSSWFVRFRTSIRKWSIRKWYRRFAFGEE